MITFGFAFLMICRLLVAMGKYVTGMALIFSGTVGAMIRLAIMPALIALVLTYRWGVYGFKLWRGHVSHLKNPATAVSEPPLKALFEDMAKAFPEDAKMVARNMYRKAYHLLKDEGRALGHALAHEPELLAHVMFFFLVLIAFFLWVHLYWFI